MPLSDSTLYIWWPQPSLKESCNNLLKWSDLYIMTSSVALTLTKLVPHFDLVVQIRWLKVVIAEKKLYNFQSLMPKIWWPYIFLEKEMSTVINCYIKHLGKNLTSPLRSNIFSDFQNRNSDLKFRSPGKVLH